MAKSIIMHNPFEDIPDFRSRSTEKREYFLYKYMINHVSTVLSTF